jgi:hypothetical protein
LLQTKPFPQDAFDNRLTNTKMSDEDYEKFLNDWELLKIALKKDRINGWDYLEFYNRRDVRIMIKPISFLNKFWSVYKINMLNFMTLASCAQAVKYSFLYKNMDMKLDYINDDTKMATFELSMDWLRKRCEGYNQQDRYRNRDIVDNIKSTPDTLLMLKDLMRKQENKCALCSRRFTEWNAPTLDRKNNDKGHSIDNIQLACLSCNRLKSNHDEAVTKVRIKLKNYAHHYKLPMTITNEETIRHLENAKFGGLSNVMHRKNIAGETHINHFGYANNKVISFDQKDVMTHVIGVDFNSLYPSVGASIHSELNPYTYGFMYMPGRFLGRVVEQKRMMEIVNERKVLVFFVSVKGHFPKEKYNELINFPPIIRP